MKLVEYPKPDGAAAVCWLLLEAAASLVHSVLCSNQRRATGPANGVLHTFGSVCLSACRGHCMLTEVLRKAVCSAAARQDSKPFSHLWSAYWPPPSRGEGHV